MKIFNLVISAIFGIGHYRPNIGGICVSQTHLVSFHIKWTHLLKDKTPYPGTKELVIQMSCQRNLRAMPQKVIFPTFIPHSLFNINCIYLSICLFNCKTITCIYHTDYRWQGKSKIIIPSNFFLVSIFVFRWF